MLQALRQTRPDCRRKVGLKPEGNLILVARVGRLLLQGQIQSLYQHGHELSFGHQLFRAKAGSLVQGLPHENSRLPHPLGGKPAILPQGIRVLGGIRGLENGDGHRGLPGGLPRRVGCGIDKGIDAHFIFLWGVGEAAVLGDRHNPSARLAGNSVGQRLILRIGGLQLAGVGKILIGFQGGILGNGRLILLTSEGQGEHRRFRRTVGIDGQIPHLQQPVFLCVSRPQGHLRNLLGGQYISGVQRSVP